ncbi:MAG: hypothetical protein IMW89_19675 [Ktedonobacteraceae bacterium]|nr:hypothetical protein [Ktedonobacteraceae bacterium]
MQLHDRLRVCLLAIASRYPNHTLDLNESLLGVQPLGAEGWLATDVIEFLEQSSPALLQEMASLVIDPQKSELYLLNYSQQEPAIIVHCRGRIPCCKGNMHLRQQARVQETAAIPG